jgi:multiple sugar transport system permease protein
VRRSTATERPPSAQPARAVWWRAALAALVLSLAAFASAQERVQLRLMLWEGDQALRTLRQVVADFERAHPNIDVRIENVHFGAYFQRLLAQYAAHVAPDVVAMGTSEFLRFAERGALEPLDDLIARTPGFDLGEYYPQIVEASKYGGRLYLLPRDIAPKGLIYFNKRAFDEAGIPYPDGSWTWDFQPRPELRERCFTWVVQQLTKTDERGRKRWGFTPGWPGVFVETLVLSSGGRFVDRLQNPTRLLYDDPRVIRAFQFAADLSFKHGWVPTPTEIVSVMQTTSLQLFIQGRTAMFQSGIWDTPIIRPALRPGTPEFFEWDITLAPAFRDGTRAFTTGGTGYSIMRGTRHREEAWKLIRWLSGEPGMTALARAGLAQPAIRRLALSDAWLPGPDTPIDQRFPANRIVTDEAIPYVVFEPAADYWGELFGIVQAEMDRIFNGTATAEEALLAGNARANARLATILREERLPRYNWIAGWALGLAGVAALVAWIFWPDRRRRRTRQERHESRTAWVFLSPWIIGMIALTLGPMLLSLLMSFAEWDIIQPAQWRGAGNYAEALHDDPRFWVSLRVTALYTLFAVPLGIVGALILALLLNVKVRGIAFYRTMFYLPALASTVAASLIWMRIFQPEGGLLNRVIYGEDGQGNFLGLASLLANFVPPGQQANWLGLEQLALPALIIMSLWGVGAGMVILLAGLQGIPHHYYEAATLDGAGPWQRFRAVTFPLLTPALFFSLITGVIGSFQVFTQAFVMTAGGPNNATRFYMLHLYETAFGGLRMGYASALAWILFLVILVFTAIQFTLNRFVYYEADGR